MSDADNPKVRYYWILYGVIALYLAVSVILYAEWFRPIILMAAVFAFIGISGLLLVFKRYVASQFTLFSGASLVLYIYADRIHYFHFYGNLVMLLFAAVILCFRRWQQYVVNGLTIALLIYRSYVVARYVAVEGERTTMMEDHLFITLCIVFLGILTVYMDRMTLREGREKDLLAKSSDIDLLTETYTRSRLNRDVSDAPLTKGGYNMAVLDIDLFKSINDTYGHETGDHILQSLAKGMKSAFSEPDYRIYRWGGEEFVIIATGMDERTFTDGLERFRLETDRDYLGAKIHMTVSIGTVWVAEGEAYEEAFKRCDNALYQAKGMGRNRLVKGGVSA